MRDLRCWSHGVIGIGEESLGKRWEEVNDRGEGNNRGGREKGPCTEGAGGPFLNDALA